MEEVTPGSSTEGRWKREAGNNTKGTLTAKIELTSGVTGEVSEKEFVFSGAFELENVAAAPAKVVARATKFNK